MKVMNLCDVTFSKDLHQHPFKPLSSCLTHITSVIRFKRKKRFCTQESEPFPLDMFYADPWRLGRSKVSRRGQSGSVAKVSCPSWCGPALLGAAAPQSDKRGPLGDLTKASLYQWRLWWAVRLEYRLGFNSWSTGHRGVFGGIWDQSWKSTRGQLKSSNLERYRLKGEDYLSPINVVNYVD